MTVANELIFPYIFPLHKYGLYIFVFLSPSSSDEYSFREVKFHVCIGPEIKRMWNAKFLVAMGSRLSSYMSVRCQVFGSFLLQALAVDFCCCVPLLFWALRKTLKWKWFLIASLMPFFTDYWTISKCFCSINPMICIFHKNYRIKKWKCAIFPNKKENAAKF